MTRILLLLAVMMVQGSVWAQDIFQKPDYKAIKDLTTDKSSPYYYDKLFAMYQHDDTTLSLKDYRMLYYGYFFQHDYRPYTGYYNKAYKKLNRIYDKKEYNKRDLEKVIKLSLEYLEDNPFDARKLFDVYTAYELLGDSVSGMPYLKKAMGIGKAILSTGDGLTKETAYHILHISNEYFVILALGYDEDGDRMLTEEWCDYLSLKKNDDGVNGLYFNVAQMRKAYMRKYKNERH